MTSVSRYARIWLLAGALVLPSAGVAQSSPAPTPADAVPVEPSGLAAFVDGAVAQEIASRDVARRGGHRGPGRPHPCSRAATAFATPTARCRSTAWTRWSVRARSASCSTWIALAQQVERARSNWMRRSAAISTSTCPRSAIARSGVRDLFSHSPGLSDVGDFIRRPPHPARTLCRLAEGARADGGVERGRRSPTPNYGAALAGYIVERTSGEPFADYVERHVLQPLGMDSTTFRGPAAARSGGADGRRLHLGAGALCRPAAGVYQRHRAGGPR